jgi:lysophospholipase L1-like esterase
LVVLPSGARADESERYYVSLGDSLAAGVQPTGPPPQQETDEGYADQLHAILREDAPKLRLVKLGCPGESTTSMRFGSQSLSFTFSCGTPEYYRHRFPHETQLAEAVAFLHAHKDKVALVTIDIGANDTVPCFGAADRACFDAGLERVRRNLTAILRALREAAGPGVPIVGMTYYNPFLGSWLWGPDGRAFALFTNEWIRELNDTLEGLYPGGEAAVADVEGGFGIFDFGDEDGDGVPDNVERACAWTWWCSAVDVHATAAGYGVIAAAFAAEL